MKRLAYLLLTLMLFAACTHTSHEPRLVAADSLLLSRPDSALTLLRAMTFSSTADRMYHQLLLADACNKCYDTLPPDSILSEVADFYDRHGSANEQLRAHYLLGCAYRDLGEAPQALECYQDAIDCADTLAADCNYRLLSRIYGQMASIFYDQFMYRQYYVFEKLSERYAWKAQDTLAALISYEKQGVAYDEMGMKDSSLYVIEGVAALYSKYGYPADAAIALGNIVHILIENNQIEKARRYIELYETESGLFNKKGDIEKGREIFYNVKASLYLSTNRLDSAEYWYRKELRNGKDYNNQNGAALGLVMVYERRHIPDSAAKYYQLAYAANDSMYAQKTTEEVARMQSMYDYTRYKETARKASERAAHERQKWLLSLFVLLLLVIIVSLASLHVYKKRKESLRKYHDSLEQLEKVQSEVLRLRPIVSKNAELSLIIEDKEKEIETLRRKIQGNSRKVLQDKAAIEAKIKTSSICKSLFRKANSGSSLSKTELRSCRVFVIENLPELNNLLLSKKGYLNDKEFDLCVLFRLGLLSKEASNVLNVSSARISQMSSSVLQKLFGINEGGAKVLCEELRKYC